MWGRQSDSNWKLLFVYASCTRTPTEVACGWYRLPVELIISVLPCDWLDLHVSARHRCLCCNSRTFVFEPASKAYEKTDCRVKDQWRSLTFAGGDNRYNAILASTNFCCGPNKHHGMRKLYTRGGSSTKNMLRYILVIFFVFLHHSPSKSKTKAQKKSRTAVANSHLP